ncbi:MAG: hypothetical protein ACOC1K_01250 [Nanoarchaeota archaeon]
MNWFYDYREKEILSKAINSNQKQSAKIVLDDFYESISNRLKQYKKNYIINKEN